MRLVIQRVERASVRVEGREQASIGRGILVLLGVARGDTPEAATELARKVAALRIFPDAQGRTGASLHETGGAVLCVSQFTLLAELKGRRPGFGLAEAPEAARSLWEHFCRAIEAEGLPCSRGVFGADMQVELVNDGPFTLVLETPPAG